MAQLTAQLDEIQTSAHEASEMMEGEQMEKRELEEKLAETTVSTDELKVKSSFLDLTISPTCTCTGS